MGYLVTLGYVFFLIFVLGALIRKVGGVETSRKTIHIMLFMVWVLIDVFFRNTIHQVIIPVIFLILNALSYRFRIYGSIERTTDNHMGTVYFAMAITGVMAVAYFEPAFYLPSGAAAFCLTFGDGFAALIGKKWKTHQVRPHKSLGGMTACFISAGGALLLFRWLRWPAMSLLSVLLLALLTAVAELCERGLDNFTITFSVFFASYALTGTAGADAAAGIAWALGVFAVVFFARAITYGGSLLAMVMVFTFRYFGGKAGLAYLLLCYFSIFLIGKLKRGPKKQKNRKAAQRNALQIAVNGSIGTLCVLLYGFTGQQLWFMLSMIAIGGCFIDSVSSDVGQLSSSQPYDLLRRCRVPTGISGGVTVLGTSAALIGSLLIAAFAFAAAHCSLPASVLIGLFVFLQTVLDTLMGGIFQVKYRCKVCGELTEKYTHCQADVEYASGIRWIDNNMVNMLSSILTTALAYGALTLLQ